jgi:hypothetical protein
MTSPDQAAVTPALKPGVDTPTARPEPPTALAICGPPGFCGLCGTPNCELPHGRILQRLRRSA